jgi:hypothetical protein
LVAAVSVLAGCGGSAHVSAQRRDDGLSRKFVDRASGLAVRVPAGWQVDQRPLTMLRSPHQLLVLSSFPIRQGRPDNNCSPTTATGELPPSGALLLVLGQTPVATMSGARALFGTRPNEFHLERLLARQHECFGNVRELGFHAAGQDIYVLAYFGPKASAHTQQLADQALDSLVLHAAGTGASTREQVGPTRPAASAHITSRSRSHPDALVTDESQDLLAIVDLRSGTARRFIGIAGGPQYVAAEPGAALVSSPAAGAVTLLAGRPLRVMKVFHGFATPHVIEISPDGERAYVTDDARGTLTVIRLSDKRITSTLRVGPRAHHMAFSLDQRRVWIALGENARTIVILDTSDADRPRVIGRFDPGFPAHDLTFTADGRRVAISSASSPDVTVVRASDHRPLFRVRVGPPPQHIAASGASMYLTSGYGSTIERVSARTGKLLSRARTPYGSFELAANDGLVTTASLLVGKVAIYTPQLQQQHVLKLGPATRDVQISDN